jgi:hypothetical protein
VSGSTIPNGIYAFENVGNTDSWIKIEQEMDSAGYRMLHYSFDGTSPAVSFTRSGLYKVTQVGTTGRYVIRSMLNNLLSFGYENGGIYTKEIPAQDELVSVEDTFYINYDAAYGGYTMRPYNSTQYISVSNAGASEAPEEGYAPYLTLGDKSSKSAWTIEQVVGTQQWGGTLYFNSNSYLMEKKICVFNFWVLRRQKPFPQDSVNVRYAAKHANLKAKRSANGHRI